MRRCATLLVLGTLALGACKKQEAPPGAAAPASAGAAPKTPAAEEPVATPSPEQPPATPDPAVGSTNTEERKDDGSPRRAVLDEPTTLAEAEKRLDDALGDLNRVAAAPGAGKGAGGAKPLADGDARCGDACRAMESLRRAAEAVCRLAGEANERCSRAQKVVKDSEKRVAACGCEKPKE
jgi:hypothetical protein